MKRSGHIALAAILVIGLGGCASGGPKNPDTTGTPETKKEGIFFKTAKADLTGSAKAFKEDRRIAVPFYRITFTKTSKGTARARELMGKASMNVSQTLISSMNGVSEAAFQRITDQAYDDLLARLKDAGYDVLPLEEVQKAATYAALSQDYPDIDDDSSVCVPTGGKFPGQISTLGKNAALMADIKAGTMIVNLSVNYASLTKTEESGISSWTAGVDISQVAHVDGKIDMFTYAGAKCNSFNGCWGEQGTLHLGQSVHSEKAFGTLKDATTTGDTVVNILDKGLGLMQGQLKFGDKVRRVVMEADEAKYEDAALEAIKKANERFVAGMKQ